MSFQPVIPSSGLVGWRFLEKTMGAQQEALKNSSVVKNDAAYFRQEIRNVTTAEELVSDRRLLSVALRAFGLGDDINNRYFIQKILEGGIARSDSLANRLADSRYKAMVETFGFGDLPIPRTQLSFFADELIDRFHRAEFETGVGLSDNDMRLALNTQRELPEIATSESSDIANWFRILGNPPLRQVFETAFGLPSSFAGIDLDKQVEIMREKSDRQFGTSQVSSFSDPSLVDKLIQQFLLRSQVRDSVIPPGSVALTLLQQGATLR